MWTTECLGSLDQIANNCSFFAGRANVPDFPSVEINNGLIGCCAQHPLMNSIVLAVSNNVTVKPHQQLNALAAANTGPTNDPTGGLMAFLGSADALNLQQVIKSTDTADTIPSPGLGILTPVLGENVLRSETGGGGLESEMGAQEAFDSVVVLPPEVFNPMPNTARVKLGSDNTIATELRAPYVGAQSLACHYWQQTWQED